MEDNEATPSLYDYRLEVNTNLVKFSFTDIENILNQKGYKIELHKYEEHCDIYNQIMQYESYFAIPMNEEFNYETHNFAINIFKELIEGKIKQKFIKSLFIDEY